MSTTLPVEPMVRASYEAAREHTERLAFALGAGRATPEQLVAAEADERRLEAALAALHGKLSLPSTSPERIVHVPSASTAGLTYRVVVSPEGDSCECRGFTYRRACRHIERARALVDDPCRTLARDITDAWNGRDERGRDAWWRDLAVIEEVLALAGDALAVKAAVRVRARASAIYRAAEASLARDSERVAG